MDKVTLFKSKKTNPKKLSTYTDYEPAISSGNVLPAANQPTRLLPHQEQNIKRAGIPINFCYLLCGSCIALALD